MTPPNKLEQLAEFQDAIQSNKGLERLRAMQYLQQMNNQGLMGMPQVTEPPVIQRQGGGKVFNNLDEATAANLPPNSKFFIVDDPDPYFVDADGAIGKEIQEGITGGMDAYTAEDIEDGTVTEEKAIAYRNYLRDLEQSNQDRSQFDRRKIAEQYGDLGVQGRADGGQVAPDQAAQGLAGLGRYGDNMLLHINPEELQGLASMGKITYNPITGLPEAWSFRSFFKPFKQAARSIKKVAKSKAFRMIAPLALTIAAPYLAAAWGMGGTAAATALAGTATTAGSLSAAVAAMGPVAFGLSTAIGSGLGALAAGAKGKDALKAAALSGITAGGLRGYSNYMDPNVNVWGTANSPSGYAGTKALTSSAVKTGSPTSFGNAPSYGGGNSAQVYNNPAGPGNQLGAQRYENLQLNQPDITSGGAPGTTTVEPRPFDYGATADMGPYQGSFTPAPEPVNLPIQSQDVASNFTPGYGQTVGVPITEPNMLQRAGQQIIDSPVGRGIDQATDYVGQMPIGKGQTLGDLGGALVEDYGTVGGLLKGSAIAAATPDYLAEYEAEDERKRQLEELEKLGYDITLSDEETGFNQTIVIRDPSGKVLPSDLSLQDLLDRAYGRTPRTRFTDRITYGPANAKHGGLINLAGGGNFSGMVQGDGHGMQDNVYMPIKEQGNQVGTLAVSPSEYVVDAYTMSALGNGNPNAGAKVMDGVVESVRKKAYGTVRQPNEISGLQALKPMMMGV